MLAISTDSMKHGINIYFLLLLSVNIIMIFIIITRRADRNTALARPSCMGSQHANKNLFVSMVAM